MDHLNFSKTTYLCLEDNIIKPIKLKALLIFPHKKQSKMTYQQLKGVRSTIIQKSWLSRLCKKVAKPRVINGAPQANKLYFRYVGGSSRRGTDATVAYKWWHIAASQQTTDTRKYCKLSPSEMQSSESCKQTMNVTLLLLQY